MNNKKQEEDNVPLVQYLMLEQQKKHQKQAYFNRLPPPIVMNVQPKSALHRRPSYPSTPLSLLDTFSDDEDDQDLIPIGYISTAAALQQRKQGNPFQSAAEKYKEKVMAQLDSSCHVNILDEEDDDNLPLSSYYV